MRQRMAGVLRGRTQGRPLSPRDLSRRAELIALASLAVVLVWGLCLLPLPPSERHAAPAAHGGRSLLQRSLLGSKLALHLEAEYLCTCVVLARHIGLIFAAIFTVAQLVNWYA